MAPDGSPRGGLARALAALYARVPLGMRLGLEPMRAACKKAGGPELGLGAVHVAGTNGKGSVSAMVESLARAAGLRTGLYTSPHLCRFAERIRIDGKPLTDDALTSVLDEALVTGADLSFFETATLAAFLAFRSHDVDLAVIEVGIGGRLDATNVLPSPRVTAITKVALDHTDRLGDTLEAIAREKAGIAKPGVPMVLGPLAANVRAAAAAVAEAAGARVVDVGDADREATRTTALGLLGDYQRDNAAVAWRIAGELGLPEAARRSGLAATSWPGRFERIDAFVLDGAHNPDGARALVSALGREPIGAVVFGALADKAWPEMLDVLATLPCSARFYVGPHGRSAASPDDLAEHLPGTPCASLEEALAAARRAADAAGASTVVIAGSLYLVGEARARLLDLPADPPVSL